MTPFIIEQAYQLEKSFRTQRNLQGLVDINIQFCENLRGGAVYEKRLPKIGFYLGRLKNPEVFKTFLERNHENFQFFFSYNPDILSLTFKCFEYGYEYENLPTTSKAEIKSYFADPKYSEMFTEMMFDYVDYIENLIPFDFSIRHTRNKNYSALLVTQIGKALIDNDDTVYYDRAKNEVIELDDYDEMISGVHFQIDYTGITNKRMNSILEFVADKMQIIDTDIKRSFGIEVMGENSSNASMFGFEKYYFNRIIEFLIRSKLDTKIDKNKLSETLLSIFAIDYLNFLNSNK